MIASIEFFIFIYFFSKMSLDVKRSSIDKSFGLYVVNKSNL